MAGYPLWGSSIPSHSCPYLENICLNHCPCQNSASYLNSFKNNAKITVIKSPGSFLNKFRRISSCSSKYIVLGGILFSKKFYKTITLDIEWQESSDTSLTSSISLKQIQEKRKGLRKKDKTRQLIIYQNSIHESKPINDTLVPFK